MIVRLWAAAAVLVLGALFITVAILSFGPEERVVPTVAVTAAQGTSAPTSAAELLAQRTRLQGEPAVGSGDRVEALIRPDGERVIAMGGDVKQPLERVEQWIASVPKQPNLLQSPQFTSGKASLPYREAQVLVQPEGREFRRQHNDQIRYGGGWIIFGVSLTLALFLLARGRIGLAEPWSGEPVPRFSAFERANHWMTSSAFVIMALAGLVILYGKPLLLPWLGPDGFSSLAYWSVWIHMASALPFVIGVLVMTALWLWGNLPTWIDWEWLKRGGGLLRDDGNHPPAERFNAGQKIMFWGVVLGGLGMLATGVALMFPFYWMGYGGMQWAQLLHAGLGLAMIALIIGHIYIGTVGMEGAFGAMWDGVVDRTWAREHHSLWYERITGRNRKAANDEQPRGRARS